MEPWIKFWVWFFEKLLLFQFQFRNSDLVPVWFLLTQIGTNGWLQVNLGSIHLKKIFFSKNTDFDCGSKYKMNYGPNSGFNSLF